MHIKTYALGMTVAVGVTISWFGGCGGTTVEATGAGSTTGTGGTTGTTSSTMVTTSSSTSVSTSSTATGTTPCDKACAHIQMCTGYTCSMANIDCATVGSGYDCEFECANNTPCANLGFGTLATCQAQCSDGGAGDGGAGDGGPMLSPCSNCELQHCGGAGAACAQDATCQQWLACANTCNGASPQTPSCYAACDAQYSSASAKFAPIYQCGCTNCDTQCSGADLCNYGQDGGP